ncbi:major facilitator superfamily domain-containing protein [Filobasidium floriforme]|uniref:major facilitator superfamily domain-containing protein n=1 Tax=Filobasidium floriforme TaxID=5210 RepID=UPI001E8CCA99|nr:major facilitator superfamily domain-containing protein [Filobasidium floriforme]KAH8081119.1 major facilitator superfamily domain-containing protein [Filobasidium floriforme]
MSSETSTTPPPEKRPSDMAVDGGQDHTLKVRPWRRKVNITPFSRIASQEYPGQGTEADPYLIDWLNDDAENPMTWATPYKWVITLTAAIATLAVSMASSTLPGYKTQAYTMVTSGFVLGFVVGPLMWAPCSELYGRRNLFIFTYILFTIFNGGVIASQNIWTLIILRFFCGTAGSSPLTNAGGTVADMFNASQRGLGMAVFASAPFLGPGVGPIIGGFLGETGGWRWVAALIAMFSGCLTVVGFFITPETYAPLLLNRRAALLSKVTGNVYRYKGAPKKVEPKQLFKNALSKPWVLLFREPIVFLLSLYLAIVYGTLYMLFGAFPIVFQQERGWSPGIGGLSFLGILVGFFLALVWTIFIENPRYSRRNDAEGWLPPEQRLVPALIGGLLLPIGLFSFAWTASPKSIHWIAPIICSAPFGMGMVMVFLPILNYLVDSYLLYAASVLAANSIIRSLFGTVFPLFVTNMYANLGVNWAGTLVAFLALACAPMPFIFFKFGRTIRLKSPYSREADAMGQKMRERALQSRAEQKA